MSLDVTKDLVTHLANDGTVTAALDTYKTAPAIFTLVPEDAPDKYLALRDPFAVNDASAKSNDAHSTEQFRDLLCVTARSGTIVDVENIANAVKRSLHRATVTPSAAAIIEMIEALGPIGADAEDYFGRIVELRLIVRETT